MSDVNWELQTGQLNFGNLQTNGALYIRIPKNSLGNKRISVVLDQGTHAQVK